MKGVQLRKIPVLCTLCVVSIVCNLALSRFVMNVARLPLYLDTVFTIAMCFSAGLSVGLLTGALSYICSSSVLMYIFGLSFSTIIVGYLFFICVIVEALLVCFFYSKMKKREEVLQKPSPQSFIGIAPPLLGLVAIDCIAMSVTGGIIDFAITSFSMPRYFFPEDSFKLGLLRNNVPLLATTVLSRIPINIVDRFIAIFGGYGISLLYRKWLNKEQAANSKQQN